MSEEDLAIDIKKQGEVAIIMLAGKLDASTASKLNDAFKKVFSDKFVNIITDMSQCDYISSAGIGTFLANYKKVKASKGSLVLTALTKDVKDVFDLLKFTKLFQMTDNLEDALNKF